ncbi:MAG: hypothetical protein VYB22_06920, partial [Pseudomonadota bacterium]|nr:hypothetical protein [Pseudomonadota bacterium]
MDEALKAESTKKKKGFLPQTGDSEPEQAIKVRLAIGLAIFLYFGVPWASSEQWHETFFSTPSLITLAYYAGAIIIAAAIFIYPRPSPVRRVA